MSEEDETIKARIHAAHVRYMAAGHAVQSGVKAKIENDRKFATPKDLRTGIDTSKADMLGLVTLLISKGVFSELEYLEAIATSMEKERQRYELEVSQLLGMAVTLA